MTANPVVCPRCGGTDVALLYDEQRDRPANINWLRSQKTVRAYRCKCGVAFARTEDPEPRDPAPT